MQMGDQAKALCDGFLMSAKQRRHIRKAFMDIHFECVGRLSSVRAHRRDLANLGGDHASNSQLGSSYLSPAQMHQFVTKPHRTMGCIPYWALLLRIGERPSPFLYLIFDQILAPLLVTDELVRRATAPGQKKKLMNKAQMDERFIRYIKKQGTLQHDTARLPNSRWHKRVL